MALSASVYPVQNYATRNPKIRQSLPFQRPVNQRLVKTIQKPFNNMGFGNQISAKNAKHLAQIALPFSRLTSQKMNTAPAPLTGQNRLYLVSAHQRQHRKIQKNTKTKIQCALNIPMPVYQDTAYWLNNLGLGVLLLLPYILIAN